MSIDLVGRTIAGRYRVEAFIGRGGMAEVYRVWDGQRAVSLAMKVLHEDLADDLIFLRRFKREAQTLAALQHPHIVRIYGLEEHSGLAFMLMDYVDGSSLRKEIALRRQPFEPARVLEIMRQVCSALHYAHRQGIVHCDVKPANIMQHTSGVILVADFGIARLTESATTMTMIGAGTPAYMAPEQVRGENPTSQTDIYALGIVLYELLTGGERPFTGEQAQITGSTGEKVRWEQLNQHPPSPRHFNLEIPPTLEAIVLKCLQKEPSARFASALELLSALQSALGAQTATTAAPLPAAASGTSSQPAPDRASPSHHAGTVSMADQPAPHRVSPPHPVGEGGRGVRSLRGLAWLALAVPVVLVLAAWFGGLIPGRSAVEAPPATAPQAALLPATASPSPAPTTTPPPAPTATASPKASYTMPASPIHEDSLDRLVQLARWAENTAAAAAWSPDGKTLAVASAAEIHLYNSSSLQEVGYLDAGSTTGVLEFSPDGSLLVSVSRDGTLHLWRVADFSLSGSLEGHTSGVTSVSFSPDGAYLASASHDRSVLVWQLPDGSLFQALTAYRDGVTSLDFSPDGEMLAAGSYDQMLRLSELPSGDWRQETVPAGYITALEFSPDAQILAAGSNSGDIYLYRASELSVMQTLSAHQGMISSLSFSPDGSLLASGSDDGMVRLWQMPGGYQLGALKGQSGSVLRVAFSPDGLLLISVSAGALRLYGLSDDISLEPVLVRPTSTPTSKPRPTSTPAPTATPVSPTRTAPPNSAAPSGTVLLTIINNYKDYNICDVLIRESTSSQYATDLLSKGYIVKGGGQKSFSIPPGTYDIRLQNCAGDFLIKRGQFVILSSTVWAVP